MNRLDKIQKIIKVFKIISLVAMILTYVGAGLLMLSAITFTAMGEGKFSEMWGQAISSVMYSQLGTSFNEVCATLWVTGISGLFEGGILAAIFGYLKSELTDGTPFTENGALRLRKVGIKVIILPIISAAVCSAVSSSYHVTDVGDISNLTEVVFGVALIIISLIFGYGAELESKITGKTE